MAQIGLKNLYYATVTEDKTTGTTYGDPVRIAGLININVQPSINTNTLHADDVPWATNTSLNEITVSIETADLSDAAVAALLGHEITDGTIKYKGDDEAPYVALLFESEKDDGGVRFVKLLKGKFHDSDEELQTKGDQIEYQTPSIEGTFICRESDGAWKLRKDVAKSGVATARTSWFAAV